MTAGVLTLSEAFPDFFWSDEDVAFPSKDADMSQFEWEKPTEESYRDDLERMMGENAKVVLREAPAEEIGLPPVPEGSLEWT